MPDINTPNYPVTESPKLSPNPKLTTSYEDGGRGTPTIVVTEAKEQPDTTGVSLPEYTGVYEITENGTLETAGKALKEDIVVAIPEYDGSYSVTANGTLPTEGKVMTSDLAVNVVSDDKLSKAWAEYKKVNKTNWEYALTGFVDSKRTTFTYIDSFDDLDFSGSENVKNMNHMFYQCRSLTSVPLFDTSSATDMSNMFYNCSSLTSVPLFDTSSATNTSGMFSGCSSLTSVPLLDTSSVTDIGSMFNNCSSLTSVPLLDTSSATYMGGMFNGCSSLTSIPLLDTSSATDMRHMLRDCNLLTSIPALNVSNSNEFYYIFFGCHNLESIHMFGMKANFDISPSTKFTREALLEIINNCQDLTGQTSHKITMGSTNLAKLTAEDKLIATNKNWTLA